MGNAWFQFKQFRVEQAGAALKVGTDACILGAWAQHPAPDRILDIGTGTGLLSLMLAQRYGSAQIEALEPEPEAVRQAGENFNRSPWADRLLLHSIVVQEFFPDTTFDLIVCNPPFYPDHLKSDDRRRNLALHQEMLRFDELAAACARLLAKAGICFILLPPSQAVDFQKQALLHGLHIRQRLLVQERTHSRVHRTVIAYTAEKPREEEVVYLTIRAESGDYSPHYQALLKEFYLNM